MKFLEVNMLQKNRTLRILFCFLILPLALLAQREIPPKPKTQTSVYDEANLLDGFDKINLERKLIKYADTTSTQIVVATIKSLQGEDIGIYAVRWAQNWGIGQSKEDNGIFVLVAKDDRKIWIAPGYGTEIKLTAGINGTIIRNIILPEFKNGNFYGGLDKGTDAIFEVLDGAFEGVREIGSNNEFPAGSFIFILFVFIIVFIALSKNNRGGGGKGGNRNNSGSLLDIIILSSMGRGSFGGGSGGLGGGSGGSFGGGGFGGGFGGGGFSGGGAGGSW